MSKKYFVVLAVLFFGGLQAQIINIPDPNFKAQLLSPNICRDLNGQPLLVDANSNGQIEVNEALNVSFIYFQQTAPMQNLIGIEYFTNLKTFYVGTQAITTFNASPLVNLELLSMYGGTLQTINLTGLVNLKDLDLGDNNLSVLNVSGLTGLEHLQCDRNNLTALNVSGLTNLKSLDCWRNQITSLNLSGLPSITYVNCEYNSLTNLQVAGVSTLTSITCNGNHLTSLDLTGLTALAELDCSDNDLTALNITQSTALLNLYCQTNNLSSLNLSGQVNLYELNCSSNQITALNPPGMPNLNTLRCNGNLLTSLTLNNFPMLQELNCNDNLLTSLNLTGLNNAASDSALSIFCNNNQLASIDLGGTLKILSLQCVNNLLTSLNVSSQPSLWNLNCSDNRLTTIDISQNPALQYFRCNNNLLTSIFMKNGKLETGPQFSGNPNLQYVCADEGQIATVQNLISTYGYTNCTTNAYCSFVPGGVFYTIQGSQTYDADANGCTAADGFVPNMTFSIANGTTTGSMISDTSGNYNIAVQAGSHTVASILENPGYFTVSPASVAVNFPAQASPFTQNFCIAPNGTHNDLGLIILPIVGAVAGNDAQYKIIFRNKGTHVQSGIVSLNFDDSRMDFVSAIPASSGLTANTITWNFSNLNPFESREITLIMNVNSPMDIPAVNSGDVLPYVATISALADEIPSDNTMVLNEIVVSSFDPNDKTCLEGLAIGLDGVGKDVHYKIRFENTGTANAQNIVVRDEIDLAKYDINTLVPLGSSHTFVTKITNNKVEFVFENIQLPFDDTSNDGYVVFKIKTKTTLQPGDTFSNTAAIYFDYNFPIITNTATTAVAMLANQDFAFSDYVQLYPNPAQNVLHVEAKDIAVSSMGIYNVLGQLVTAIPNAGNKVSIDVSNLKAGTYFLKINSEKGSTNTQFIRQ